MPYQTIEDRLDAADAPAPPPPVARTGRGGRPPRPQLHRSRRLALLLALLTLLLAGGGALAWKLTQRAPAPAQLSYSALLRALSDGRVRSLTVVPGREVRGELATPTGGAAEFASEYPLTSVDELTQRAEAAGVELTLQRAGPRRARDILSLLLQLSLLGGLGYLVYLQLRGQRGGELGSTAPSSTTFADVAGTQGAAEELQELVQFLQDPGRFRLVGARIPKGALLVGPPGTGKTLLARAVAGEAGVPFYSISGSEVTGFLVGLGAQRIKTLFRRARKSGGVIFIDEIDALGGKRGRNQSHNEDDRTLNQLLVEMDGFSPSAGVVVVAATNRPDSLDPALKRPGRFDRTITVGLPTADERAAILRLHAEQRGVPLSANVDVDRLARLTPGSSGAELANLLNEAAIAAAREDSRLVYWSHVEQARDRMLLGKERVGFRAHAEEWRTVAFHEAGHAIAGVVCCPEDGLHKVTIQPRGQAMGVAYFSPDAERHLYRRSYLEGQIMKGLAGRAAEELVFGPAAVTTGAGNDLQQVNDIARRMIYQLGMGEQTGLLIHDGQLGTLSAEAHARMDAEVRSLLERLYQKTLELLRANREALDALAGALLEKETLDGLEALALLDRHGVTRARDCARAVAALLPQ